MILYIRGIRVLGVTINFAEAYIGAILSMVLLSSYPSYMLTAVSLLLCVLTVIILINYIKEHIQDIKLDKNIGYRILHSIVIIVAIGLITVVLIVSTRPILKGISSGVVFPS